MQVGIAIHSPFSGTPMTELMAPNLPKAMRCCSTKRDMQMKSFGEEHVVHLSDVLEGEVGVIDVLLDLSHQRVGHIVLVEGFDLQRMVGLGTAVDHFILHSK